MNKIKVIYKDDEFEVLIGDDAASLFEYYEIFEMHGLNYKSCIERMKQGGTYIDGLCNFVPIFNNPCHYDFSKWFVFFNLQSFQHNYRDNSLIQHEFTHAGFKKYAWDTNKEEEIIQYGEDMTNRFYPEIKKYINYRLYKDRKNGNQIYPIPETGLNL